VIILRLELEFFSTAYPNGERFSADDRGAVGKVIWAPNNRARAHIYYYGSLQYYNLFSAHKLAQNGKGYTAVITIYYTVLNRTRAVRKLK